MLLRYTRTFCCQASHSQWSGGASQVHLQHTKGQRTPGSRPGRSGGGTSGTQRTAATELRCLPYLMSQPPSSLHRAVVIAPKTYFKRQIYTNILPLICKFTSGCFQRRLRRGPWGTGGGPAGAGQGASHRTAGTARAAQPRAAVGELHLLYTDAVPSGRASRPAPPSARRGGARSRAGRAAEAGRQRGASHGPGLAVAQPVRHPAGSGRCLRGGRAARGALLRHRRGAADGAHWAAGAGHGAGQRSGHPGVRGGPAPPHPGGLLLPQLGRRRPPGGWVSGPAEGRGSAGHCACHHRLCPQVASASRSTSPTCWRASGGSAGACASCGWWWTTWCAPPLSSTSSLSASTGSSPSPRR